MKVKQCQYLNSTTQIYYNIINFKCTEMTNVYCIQLEMECIQLEMECIRLEMECIKLEM